MSLYRLGNGESMKMVVFGTRPEIIKLYPVIKAMRVKVVHTGQHDELANQILKDLGIKPDIKLNVMKKNQSLSELSSNLHLKLGEMFDKEKPELVIVQGDTTTAMITALEAYYHKIPVAHVEAGLRTNDIYSPFPEEVNRRIITQIASYNFCSTKQAAINCKREGWGEVYQVGQTGIDTLLEFSKKINVRKERKLLITLHRRENISRIPQIAEKIIKFMIFHSDWKAIMPIHPNPSIKEALHATNLKSVVRFVKPLSYVDMLREIKSASLILTDSGGLQEEAPYLNTPVVFAREVTERSEGILGGFTRFLGDELKYFKIPEEEKPYGDGKAGKRIARWLQ